MGAIPEPGRLEPDHILMLDQILDGYLETDTTGIITSVNLPFIDARGLRERSEVTGNLFWELTRKQYAHGIMLTYRSVIESGVPSEYIRIICQGKRRHPGATSAN
jgi:PAS domain-containing protein